MCCAHVRSSYMSRCFVRFPAILLLLPPAVELSGNLNTAEGLETARRACSIIRISNPSKNVSTLQPRSVSCRYSRQKWLKGLSFKPFKPFSRGSLRSARFRRGPGGTSPRTGKRKPATVFSIGGVETTEAGTEGRVKYEEEEGQMGDKPLLGMAEWFRVRLNGLKGLKNKPFSHFCTENQRKRRGG